MAWPKVFTIGQTVRYIREGVVLFEELPIKEGRIVRKKKKKVMEVQTELIFMKVETNKADEITNLKEIEKHYNENYF